MRASIVAEIVCPIPKGSTEASKSSVTAPGSLAHGRHRCLQVLSALDRVPDREGRLQSESHQIRVGDDTDECPVASEHGKVMDADFQHEEQHFSNGRFLIDRPRRERHHGRDWLGRITSGRHDP